MLSLQLPQGRAFIAARVPHGGAMCLLDELLACDELHIRCASSSHRAADNPLRTAGRLGAACALEYAGQAMALHGALLSEAHSQRGAAAQSGMLAAVRELTLLVTRLDDLPAALEIDCLRVAGDARTMLYRFTIDCAGRPIASGRATIVSGGHAGAPQ